MPYLLKKNIPIFFVMIPRYNLIVETYYANVTHNFKEEELFMKKLKSFEYLDDKEWSPLWEQYVHNALLFIPSKIQEIICIIPIPDRDEILILSDNGTFISNKSILLTLQSFASTHCYPDYAISSHSLKRLKLFGQYKLPWFCPYFALFPLESADQTIWLNPLKINDIFEHEDQFYVELINELILLLPISKRRITKHAEIAALLLATIARGNFHTNRPGTTPLDFLDLPNTPFARYLSKRKLLQKFLTPIGKLRKQYHISYVLYHCPDLIEESDADYEDNWI